MDIDGKKVNGAAFAEVARELMEPDGSTTTITANILRNWSARKRRRFARHLLGDDYKHESEEPK